MQVPLSEPDAVKLIWAQIRGALTLALATKWLKQGEAGAADKIADLFEGSQFVASMTGLAGSGRTGAVASLCSYAINTAAGCDAFAAALLSPLRTVLSATLIAPGSPQAIGAISLAAAHAVTQFLPEDTAGLDDEQRELAEGAVEVDERGDDKGGVHSAFAAVCVWVAILATCAASADDVESDALLTMTEDITAAVYALLGQCSSKGAAGQEAAMLPTAQLAHSLVASLEPGASWVQQTTGRLFATQRPWLAVLAAWVADADELRAVLRQQSSPCTLAHVEAAIRKLQSQREPGPSSNAETAAYDALMLQDGLDKAKGASAVALWYELFYRVAGNRDAIQPILDRERILVRLGSTAQDLYPRSSELANELTRLNAIVDSEEAAAKAAILPFVGSIVAAARAAAIDTKWNEWAVATVAQPLEPVQTAAAESSTGLPHRLPPSGPEASSTLLSDKLRQLSESMVSAEDALRAWVRRSEKAAAIPEGEDPSPAEGREGDVFSVLAEAQRLLWEGSNRWSDEVAQLHQALRQLVCQQYVLIDVDYLQGTSEMYEDKQRIPRQLRNATHGKACSDLRQQARSVATDALTAKEIVMAANKLFMMECLLLEYDGTSAQQSAAEVSKIKTRLLQAVAQSLADGSSPPVAAPYIVGLFERAVKSGKVGLDGDAKLRLVPRIVRALAGVEGAPPPLAAKEGARLLRASLDPDALLDAGRLREYLTTLALVQQWCCDVGDAQATAMLQSFDVRRFATLVVEAGGQPSGAGGSSSKASFS